MIMLLANLRQAGIQIEVHKTNSPTPLLLGVLGLQLSGAL